MNYYNWYYFKVEKAYEAVNLHYQEVRPSPSQITATLT